jgi:hypothetical protein
MKRILLLATVAVLMAVMLVAMASAALAVPPASGLGGCSGGKSNALHTQGFGNASYGGPSNANDAPGTQDNAGLDRASDNANDTSNCRNN